MNPITNARNQNKLNERELAAGVSGGSGKSWHGKYADSAWIFVGGLDYGLTEGDVVCVFSQWGELVNVNLVRDNATGKSKGFAFVCYEDQRATVLAVDNFNGTKLCNRIIRVDHVEEYKVPKVKGDEDEETMRLWADGVAPKPVAVDQDARPASPPAAGRGRDGSGKKRSRRSKGAGDLLPLDDGDRAAIKKHKKAVKKAKKEAAKQAKLEREKWQRRSMSPCGGGGDSAAAVKSEPSTSRFGDKGKRHYDGLDDSADYDRTMQHKVVMTKYDQILIEQRYKAAAGPMELPTDWRAREVEKMERDRLRALEGDDGKAAKKLPEHYMPTRFAKR